LSYGKIAELANGARGDPERYRAGFGSCMRKLARLRVRQFNGAVGYLFHCDCGLQKTHRWFDGLILNARLS
jgi:hypothetical protein